MLIAQIVFYFGNVIHWNHVKII